MLDTTRVDLNLLVTLEALLGLRFGGGAGRGAGGRMLNPKYSLQCGVVVIRRYG